MSSYPESESESEHPLDPLDDAELLSEILRAFVRHPAQIRVEERSSNQSINLDIHVDPEDIGVVIGKDGATLFALRHIFGKVGAASERRVFINVAGADPHANRVRPYRSDESRNDPRNYRVPPPRQRSNDQADSRGRFRTIRKPHSR